jgi:arylamine N-acetyltransferase
MVNIVSVGDTRYLVDVGFGAACPTRPLPLNSSEIIYDGVKPQQIHLESKRLPFHTDSEQRAFVYSHRASETELWVEAYSVVPVECHRADFEVLNLSTMASPNSFFVKMVLAQRIFLDAQGEPEGLMILLGDQVKRKIRSVEEEIQVLRNETERIVALEKYFQVVLSEKQKAAIRGHWSELKE